MRRAELVQAVEGAIMALAPAYRGQATESDLYEAALLTVAVEAATAAGGTCLITNDGRTSASALTFRRNPGNLWLGAFTYIRVEFPNPAKNIEIHLGVYVVGLSRVAHECDVAILSAAEAERSRQGAVHPRKAKLVASIEAKHYAASPGLNVGRSFLGLAAELGPDHLVLAFPARGSASIMALTARRPSQCFDELIPHSPSAERLRSHLDQKIRKWLNSR